jgi:hypothetical protein
MAFDPGPDFDFDWLPQQVFADGAEVAQDDAAAVVRQHLLKEFVPHGFDPAAPQIPELKAVLDCEHQRLDSGAVATGVPVQVAVPVFGAGQFLSLRAADSDVLYPQGQHGLAAFR